MDVDALTRKGKGKGGKSKGKGKGSNSKHQEKRNSKGNDTEKEKVVRFEGYCGHWQMGASTKGLLVETWKTSEQGGN